MFTLVLVATISVIRATTIDKLEELVKIVGVENLSAGSHQTSLKDDAENYLASKGDVGIILEVENYSEYRLEKPELFLYAGEKDSTYGNIHNVTSKEKELFIFHNEKEVLSRSQGSVSWLVSQFLL